MADLANVSLPRAATPSPPDEGAGPPVGHAPLEGEPPPPSADFEQVLKRGFRGLRFPAWLEALYLQDKATERLRLIRGGTALIIALSTGMLLSDWLMVPDQIGTAITLRLFVFAPMALALLAVLGRLSPAAREISMFVTSLMAAAIPIVLCLKSRDALAPTYVVSLALIQLFNGGVVRMRFWMALRVDALVLIMFGATLYALGNASPAVTTSMTMVVVSATIFTLYASYWLERRERKNWLMLQHEHQLLDELTQGNRQLDRLSRLDPLTELANRRHFDDFLEQVWARTRLDGQEVALLMMDIDHFKQYNDHHGHPAGDVCLKRVAFSLKSQLRRPGDLVARLGGEEFIAVLNHTTLPMALAAAERVRQGVEALELEHPTSPSGPWVTISVGVASACPAQADNSPAGLIAAVDHALYQAKSQGRNRVTPWQATGAPAT